MPARRRTAALAWALGGGGAAACAITVGVTVAAGLASAELFLYLTFFSTGFLGAFVAARTPRNPVGWLMCAASLASVLFFVPLDYGYTAAVVRHGSWPLGGLALWLGTWTWTPVIGLFLPFVSVRFPDGKVRRGWWIVDPLAIAGALGICVGLAFAPPDLLQRFLLVPTRLHAVVIPYIQGPYGLAIPRALSTALVYMGLGLTLVAYVASVSSTVDRYRHARGDERQQLKWFALAAVLLLLTLAYGLLATLVAAWPPDQIQIAYHIAFLALPLSVAIAILRYRLYDIDLIINKTLVYGSLTAILGALYAAVVTLLNRTFISLSGQRSDAAYVLTAFLVVVAASPVKDWLQHQVDRRIPHASPNVALEDFRSHIDAVLSVIDVHRVARHLLDHAIDAFDARGAALYLHAIDVSSPIYSRGHLIGEPAVEVPLQYEHRQFGRLVMGTRRGDIPYTENDRALLRRSADSVGEAIALATHLGFQPLSKVRSPFPDSQRHAAVVFSAQRPPAV